MKILSAEQIRNADNFTIENEPISSVDLMERASSAFVSQFLRLHPEKKPVYIFCGTGNNGGDGLAISRLLKNNGWTIFPFVIGEITEGSDDFTTNLKRLKKYRSITDLSVFPKIDSHSIIIDGLFGTGLTRPIEGLYAKLIEYLNAQKAQKISIDIPSGLYVDKPILQEDAVFEADCTISFQMPKLTFFLPDYRRYTGKWSTINIGLHEDFIAKQPTNLFCTTKNEMINLVPQRMWFTHKNQVGRLMIVAGSVGKIGAAILCARAAFRAGVGLVNVHTPHCGIDALQIAIPEAMVSVDEGETHIESIPKVNDVVAIGPGIATELNTVSSFRGFIKTHDEPLVIDADGINILSENKDLLEHLPKQSILTPHPGEFKKLVGEWQNDFDKLTKLRNFCVENEVNVVLKGAYSAVCNTEGNIFFNPTGNPGLATAGSGDVLTGIVGALLAQGLTPFEALRLGVYLHGASGDEAVSGLKTSWIQASDIISFIGFAVNSLVN
ncbi:NAD(P)H-hydrate dehydratase [Ekhidna sp.]